MKCKVCGAELFEGGKFCGKCGALVEVEAVPAQEPEAAPAAAPVEKVIPAPAWFATASTEEQEATAAVEEAPIEAPEETPVQASAPTQEPEMETVQMPKITQAPAPAVAPVQEPTVAPASGNNTPVVPPVAPNAAPKAKKKTKAPLIIGIVAAIVVVFALLISGVVGLVVHLSAKPVSDDKAEDMLAEVTDKLQHHNYKEAEKLLSKIKLQEGSQYETLKGELSEIISAKPEVVSADTSDYPNVTVEFKINDKNIEYTKADFEIQCDDSSVVPISAIEKSGKNYKLTYMATEDEGGRDVEDEIVFLKYKEVEFSLPFEFVSKDVAEAEITLVTSNVKSYPEISLYLKVVDEDGNPIDNLAQEAFTVREYLNINDYLERDVIYAAKVDGKDALNVSLAIDRSGSIDDSDMDKIKNATNNFLSKLQFSSGDKAEIVAFDTNVMQMCLFTNNKDNLMNGVNSMYPYGMTACYDAIVRSVENASLQSGARCVIVFTDGLDNESINTADSVIRIAQERSVPVYTIGVGYSLDEYELRRIASNTGGTYHHIDDISSMSQIYDEIYREQKNLYHVKYISDTSLSQDSERRIVLKVAGGGHRGVCDRTYTPIVPVTAASHSSRYEVIKADITWEDANRLCINKGGHLATITSKAEEDKIIAVAEASGIERLWIGGYTTNDRYGEAVGHWVMGEPFTYQNWFSEDEPSRFDSDNAEEFYLMLWKIDGRWSWNDQRNDLINSPFASTYQGQMGYVIEYEE